MGLDIYLYRYDDYKKTKELEDKYEEFSSKLWEEAGEYGELSQEKKDEISKKCEEFALSNGLDKYGSDDKGKTSIEMEYEKDPKHYFRIGYFRSSYNSSGINRILKNFGLPELSDIFGRTEEDDYHFQPNWEESLVRCEKVLEDFKNVGPYRVNHVSQNMFSQPEIHSEKEALDIFLEELGKHNDRKDDGERFNYSNKHGEFNIAEPIKVLAMIPGTYRIFNQQPCVYVVTESDNQWYITALEIVIETIKYVLSKDDKENYCLHWSS